MKAIRRHRVKEKPQPKLRKAKKTFKEKESLFTSIFESIQDGISILDKEMNIIQTSPVMEKWYSHALPLIGKKCYEAYHSRQERCDVCPSYQTIKTREPAYEAVPKRGPGGKIVGWLDLFTFPLMDAQTGQMNGVIEYVRDITDRKRAEDELLRSENEARRLAEENAIMAEIGRIISSSLDIHEVYGHFVEEIRKLLSVDRISVNIINHDDRTYTIAYSAGPEVVDRRNGDIIPLAGTITEETVRTRSPRLIQGEDLKHLRNRYPGMSPIIQSQFPSTIMVPLFSKDQVIAVLSLRSTNPNAYTEKDLRLAQRVGHQIAGAIANATLFTDRKRAEDELQRNEEEARRLAQENAIMAEIGRIISSTLDIQQVYERFAEEARNLIPFDRISVNLISPDAKTFTIAYVAGIELEGRQIGDSLPIGPMMRQTLQKRGALVIQTDDSTKLAKEFPHLLDPRQAKFRSFLKVPLFSNDQIFGVLNIRSTKPNVYSERDSELAERIGHQIAGAIANAQLFAERKQAEEALRKSEEEARRLAQENAIMAEIGRIVSSTLDIQKVYERFAEEAHKLISFDRLTINIIHPDKRTLTVVYSLGYEIAEHRVGSIMPLAGTFAELIAHKRAGEIIQAENEREICDRYPGFVNLFRAETQSKMSVPLISKDEVIGILNFRSIKSNAYSERDLRLAERVGHQIAGAIANAQLFAERKQAEEALRAERQRLETLSEYAPFGMLMVDKDGVYRYINPKFRELFGYDLKDIPDGKAWFRKAFPDSTYRHKVISAWINDLRLFPPGERRPRVFTVTCKDGTNKIVNLISVQLETGENLVSCEDITEHMRFEETLRESEERYRTLFEGSKDPVFITTREGRFVDFNKAYLDLFAYSKEDLTALHAQETYAHPEDRLKFQQEIEQKGFVTDYEVKFLRKDKKEMDCLLTASVRRDNDGAILGYQGILRDITERKRAEQEMKALEEQFRQSQKMEAIGRLAGGIAHDFNNMLTIIKGYSQLSLSDLQEAHPLRENLEGIQKATDRATALIRKILAFSRRQVMEMKVLDLNALLMDLDKLLRRIIGEDIKLVTVLAKDLGRVKADPGQIEQVILNLAINAKDAMPNGGKLTIETANAELDEAYSRTHIAVTPGHYVMFSISDTGVGISPEIRERIFEPFFTTKEEGKGTGLGLSTVYGIVKQSGGNIWVYSEPSQGTTFKIYLPREEEPLEENGEKRVEEELLSGSETALVVEDEEGLRKLAVQILQKHGYKVLEAPQGDEALLISQKYEGPIHLLITDVVMPGMSGRDLSERLTPLRPGIKTLYMSGHTNIAIIHNGVLEPGINLLQKPFTPEVLLRKVREALDK